MSIKAKQVAGVTTLVVVIVAILSGYHLATLAELRLKETGLRGQMVASAVFLRARDVVPAPGTDLHAALREDGGVRSILQSGLGFGPNVTHAAIVDPDGTIIAHGFREMDGQTLGEAEDLEPLLTQSAFAQLQAIYSDRSFEIRQPLLSGDDEFGTIRIGVSTLLIQGELRREAQAAAGGILAALIISSLFAVLLAQWMLRPIHVIQSGLTRLGRGELDVSLDLPGAEFRDLGSSFEAVSAQLSAVRARPLPSAATDLESVMENLEDAVALFSPSGEVIFTNAAMKALLAEHRDHPAMRTLIDQTLAGRKDCGPVAMMPAGSGTDASVGPTPVGPTFRSGAAGESEPAERMLVTHAIQDSTGRFLGAMLVARNLGYLSRVQSTLNYSRKLAALGRLMAGVAHEVKNPLNAMTIHLELLKRKLAASVTSVTSVSPEPRAPSPEPRAPNPEPRAPSPEPRAPNPEPRAPSPEIAKHLNVIASEIKRLDEVILGFLKFARPDELKLQPVQLTALVSDVVTTASPEAQRNKVAVKVDCPAALPEINADPGMLRQALLNLALNACQAMPDGGTLRIACRATPRRKVEIDVEDTGVGIPPEDLSRIFDLYFTTKEKGSGIGLSMVYRIVQLHDGDVDVQSTPGGGTRFRLIFPQA
jgi:signal transduction histidine kinase/PAS domain-containing protein